MCIARGVNINFGTVIVNVIPMQTIDTNFHDFYLFVGSVKFTFAGDNDDDD